MTRPLRALVACETSGAVRRALPPLTYLSVCSGIEAASVAWEPLGWRPWAFSEIDPFPCRVLAHRFGSNMPGEALAQNGVPNLGDMTRFQEWPDAAIDLLVGGTPCQDYSVAGKRAGMAGSRGQLTLTFLEIAARYRPQWIVWENVPGVLSSNGGKDFAAFLWDLGQLGYGWAYRVLDAQYVRTLRHARAVPQRRRRVFVVGYLGDWRPPAAVFLDAEGLRGDPPPRRGAGERPAPTMSARPSGGGGLGTDFDLDGGLICADVAPTLDATFADKQGLNNQHVNGGLGLFVAHTLKAEGFDGSEDGTGRGVPTIAFSSKDYGADAQIEIAPTMRAGGHVDSHVNGGVPPAIAFQTSGYGASVDEIASTMQASYSKLSNQVYGAITQALAVRRLTPMECERLQGFPDGWTQVPVRGKPAADGPRYKALGNSMAVNVMELIGQRIELVRAEMAAMEAAR